MKPITTLIISLIATLQAFCTDIRVDLITKHNDDLEYLTSIEILDSQGKKIAQEHLQGARQKIIIADSIEGKITVRITAMGYFPIEINLDMQAQTDSILISEVLLVPALRRKLPRYATCGNFAPRKKDVPKKVKILINGEERQLVPDKDDVVGVTYICKNSTTNK